LQSQVNKAAKKRLSLSGLEILHGRLRILVVGCSLPCDPPVGGHSCNGTSYHASIARSVTKAGRQVEWSLRITLGLKTPKAQNERMFFPFARESGFPDLRTTPAASFWRTPPLPPRASARSRARRGVCDRCGRSPHIQGRACGAIGALKMRATTLPSASTS